MEEPCEARIAAPLPRAVFSLKVTPSMATVHFFVRIAPSWFSENNVWRMSTWSELLQVKPRPMFCENVQLIRDADLRETRVRSWGILNNSHFAHQNPESKPDASFLSQCDATEKEGGGGVLQGRILTSRANVAHAHGFLIPRSKSFPTGYRGNSTRRPCCPRLPIEYSND